MSARLGLALTLALLFHSSRARGQVDRFVDGVRELAAANGESGTTRTAHIRAAADTMASALAEWDRQISALEADVRRQLPTLTPASAAQRHVDLGVAYRTRGRFADALKEFDAAAALQPMSSNLQILRALTLEADGRLGDAAKAFHAAWTLDPGSLVKNDYAATPDTLGDLAVRDRARTQLAERYRHFEAALATSSTPPFITLRAIPDNLAGHPVVGDATTAKAFALLAAEKYSEGVAALARAELTSGAGGDSPIQSFQRAQRDEAANHVADARRAYESALGGTLTGRSAILVAIGRLAQVDGDLDGATRAFRQAVRLLPNEAAIRKELAAAYAARGELDGAFCELMAALVIHPRDAQAHAAIGQLYLDAGRHQDAAAAFTRALDIAPERYEVRYGLATALSRAGLTADAAREFEAYEQQRRDALEQRRRAIANEVDREERARRR